MLDSREHERTHLQISGRSMVMAMQLRERPISRKKVQSEEPKEASKSGYSNNGNHHQFMLASVSLNVVFLLIFLLQKQSRVSSNKLFQDIPGSCPGYGKFPACAYESCPQQKTHLAAAAAALKDLSTNKSMNHFINLDHGDPTMFEAYWLGNGDGCTTVILGWEQMSYFASQKQFFWFVEQELEKHIRALHSFVGNAVTEGRYIVVGTGSTQLFQAALYAVSPQDRSEPASVISAIPYYSSYPVLTDYLKSGIHRWAGDAVKFEQEGPYVELVTSPNNPDGTVRHAVVNGSGPVIYDLAYYWPHYTPITAALDHDVMLFTASKSTGHAGTRIGWAIVKDAAVAQKMAKFIELNTIGVSHDSQLRASQILRSIVRGYMQGGVPRASKLKQQHKSDHYIKQNQLFHFGYSEMKRRWSRLRKAVEVSDRFSLPDFPTAFCSFFGQVTSAHPAFAWLRCNKESDCREVLKVQGGILSRSGSQFGAGLDHVRISILDRHHNFEAFLARLSALAAASSKE